jgi:hypothetical protein
VIDAYAIYAFDGIFALAHAAQYTIDAGQSTSSFLGSDLTSALQQISFEGVTGTVGFTSYGDRNEGKAVESKERFEMGKLALVRCLCIVPAHILLVAGISYSLNNYDGGTSEKISFGSWDSATGFKFKTGKSETDIVWPTTNGRKPNDLLNSVESDEDDAAMETTIIIVLAAATTIILLVVLYYKTQKVQLVKEIKNDHEKMEKVQLKLATNRQLLSMMEEENQKLHENLKMLMKYSKEEIDMIEDQIVTFRANFRKKKALSKLGGVGTIDSRKDMEKLMIAASKLESEEVIGKGR